MTDTERDVLDSDEAFLEDTIQEITALLIAHVPRSRLWRGEQLIGRLRSYTESDAAFRARCERYEEQVEAAFREGFVAGEDRALWELRGSSDSDKPPLSDKAWRRSDARRALARLDREEEDADGE